jgi:hypothetical protein
MTETSAKADTPLRVSQTVGAVGAEGESTHSDACAETRVIDTDSLARSVRLECALISGMQNYTSKRMLLGKV